MSHKCQHVIIWFSPAGTTAKVAAEIEQQLIKHEQQVQMVNLSGNRKEIVSKIRTFEKNERPCCLWVGSPVYCDHAVPLVLEWLDFLSVGECRFSVPFVTWGGVTSGVALHEMGEKLQLRGYSPIGAAKVLSVHSSTIGSPTPFFHRHPDKEDLAIITKLVEEIVLKLSCKKIQLLDLSVLDYLDIDEKEVAVNKSLAAAKASRPALEVIAEKCNACGICEEVCPVQVVSIENTAIIGDDCILCMQCVHQCPQGAFPYDHQAVDAFVRGMSAASKEEKKTMLYL